MSDLTLTMSAIEECVDCYSKNAAVSADSVLAEVFVFVVKFLLISSVCVVCRLLLFAGCQRAASSVI